MFRLKFDQSFEGLLKKRGKRIQNGFSDFLHSKGLLFFWKRGQNDSPAFCRQKETKSFEKRPNNNPHLLPPKGETKTVQEGEHFRLCSPSCRSPPRNCQRLVFGILFISYNNCRHILRKQLGLFYPTSQRHFESSPFVTPTEVEGSSVANQSFYTPAYIPRLRSE